MSAGSPEEFAAKLTELAHGVKTSESSTDGKTGEAGLGDGSLGMSDLVCCTKTAVTYVDDTLLTELVQKTLSDLVGTVVTGNLLSHDKDLLVAVHLLLHGGVESLTDGLGVLAYALEAFGASEESSVKKPISHSAIVRGRRQWSHAAQANSGRL